MKWTDKQFEAISDRDHNLMVAAAAGSGKTAVLVERIKTLILDIDKGCPIDRMLVVTFTNAAASEMKEKIEKAIREEIAVLSMSRDPDKNRKTGVLKRQLDLLPMANISTFHSFSMEVVKRFFFVIGCEPNFKICDELLANIVTDNKELPESAKIDLIVALITLKYTQSNSVCYAVDGQAIGVGAGQQSRIHCTRLAGGKADTWFLRQHPKTLALPFREDLGRPNRDNVIDGYINGNEEDVCADGIWQNYFTEQPERLTEEDKKAFLSTFDGVALGSDAFFPFSDNIKRARASGVKYVAEPGGSIRDDAVIDECNKHGMVMAFTGMRLFHH